MSSDPQGERAPRARPVADAPVQALLVKADELARRWALALLLARPLQQMAEVPLRDIADEAPALCAQVIRALDSDTELARLADGVTDRREGGKQPIRLGALAAVGDPRGAVEQVEALRGVLWEAMLQELDGLGFDRPAVRLVGDLSDRLAHVCATALGAMLAAGATSADGARDVGVRPGREEPIYIAAPSTEGRPVAVLIDEREDSRVSSTKHLPAQDPVADPVAVNVEAPGERPLDPAEARRRSEAKGGAPLPGEARPRPRPWDPVVRVTRGPAAPSDERP